MNFIRERYKFLVLFHRDEAKKVIVAQNNTQIDLSWAIE